jgi:ATP-dependent exoDNAse (exonuclease V) beta subunit
LEFPVVIFPFAEEDYSKGPREKIWLNADEEQVGLPKVLVDKNNNVSGYGESAALIYQQKKQEELLDDINILYVAMTRAEEQLYIISGIVSRNKDGILPSNTASFFIKFLEEKNLYNEGKLEYEFGSADKLSETEESKDETEIIPQLATTLNMKNIKIAQRESLMWNTKQQKAIEYGNILHEILSFIKTKDDIDLALTKAIEK